MTHTPAPWRIQEECWEPEQHAYGLRIESTSDVETLGVYSGRKIAEIPRSLGIEVSAANARLIATAPELLEALKGFFEQDIPCPFKQFDGRLKDFAEWYKRAKDIIAKAEGKL